MTNFLVCRVELKYITNMMTLKQQLMDYVRATLHYLKVALSLLTKNKQLKNYLF